MHDTRHVHQLTDHIYDAALDVAEWPRALEGLTRLFGASSAHLSIEVSRSAPGRMISFGTDPSWDRRYAEYYAPLNVAWERVQQRKLRGILTDRLILPKEEFRRSEFYNDFCSPQRAEEVLISIAYRWSDTAGCITLWRPERLGAWQSSHMDMLAKLTPHLSRAIQLNLRIGELQTMHRLAGETLYRLNCGVVLVNERGLVKFVNKTAEAVLADGALRLDQRRLAAATASETAALRRLVASAAMNGDGGSLVISRKARPSLLVFVIPARAENCGLISDQRGAIVFIRDLEQPPRRCLTAFADYFGLTPAQRALANELLKGGGLAAVAARLGVSYATARTHLVHIFQKTGVRRQAELVRLMLEWADGVAMAEQRSGIDKPEHTRQGDDRKPARPGAVARSWS